MTVHIPFLFAVALAGLAAIVGQQLVQRINLLQRNYVPEPLLGGLLFAGVIFILSISDVVALEVPDKGVTVDFLVALLTTNMGLHITPRILKHGIPLFLLFLLAGCVLGVLQFILVLPVALTGPDPVHTAVLAGPLSFVGAPYNLNPPAQTEPVAALFREAYPNLKQIAQGIMMIGVIASTLGANFISRSLFRVAHKEPPKPSPATTDTQMPLGMFSADITRLIVLVLVIISAAFGVQRLMLEQLHWMRDDYLPVIVISFLLGAVVRLGFSWFGNKDLFPEKALTVLLLGPTMNLVLAYAIMSIPLYHLTLLNWRLVICALVAIACSVGVSWVAFRVFARYTNKYYAAVIATAFLAVTTGWGPMGMSFLRRFMNEEGPVEPMPVIMPLNAFYIFPWLAIFLTQLFLHLSG